MTTLTAPSAMIPLSAGEAVPPDAFADIRRRMLLDYCKWDPQVGEVATLAPFPLLIDAVTWLQLAGWAESLAAESLAAEQELLSRPDLHGQLGLPRCIRRALRDAGDHSQMPVAARTMRFDFHWTTEGWRISEINSDVPGGFTESSAFPALLSPHFPQAIPAGNPVAAWADALVRNRAEFRDIALLSEAGYMEDHQIMAYLAGQLRARNCTPHLCGPRNVKWRYGRAFMETSWHRGPLGAIVRFVQAERLPGLGRRHRWEPYFHGSQTPLCNPGSAVLTESKRFPLVWPLLRTPLPTWQSLLPETRDPRDAPWLTDDSWLLKSAYCNTGDTVTVRAALPAKEWRSIQRHITWSPGAWIAQRRFSTLPISTPMGQMYPCIGVYTIDGRAAGIYGRMSPRAIIDFAAIDVVVLVTREGMP